jgi:hypothetical protein
VTPNQLPSSRVCGERPSATYLTSPGRTSHSGLTRPAQDCRARTLTMTCRIIVLVAAALFASAPSSHAQMGGMGGGGGGMGGGGMGGGGMGGGGGRSGRSGQQTQSPPEEKPSLPVIFHNVWPRLDPGSLLCQTQDDLRRYQAKLAGGQATQSSARPNCRRIRDATAIKILDRESISQTKVALSDDSNQTGWTNQYLPETPPNSN